MEYYEGHRQKVEKMGHHSDVTKNRTSFQNWWKDKTKSNQESCTNLGYGVGWLNCHTHTHKKKQNLEHPNMVNIYITLCSCFCSAKTKVLDKVEENMDSSKYWSILAQNL